MRLVLVSDHLIADLHNKFVFRVELLELRTSGGLALEDPKVASKTGYIDIGQDSCQLSESIA